MATLMHRHHRQHSFGRSPLFAIKTLFKNRWPYKGSATVVSIRLCLTKKTTKYGSKDNLKYAVPFTNPTSFPLGASHARAKTQGQGQGHFNVKVSAIKGCTRDRFTTTWPVSLPRIQPQYQSYFAFVLRRTEVSGSSRHRFTVFVTPRPTVSF